MLWIDFSFDFSSLIVFFYSWAIKWILLPRAGQTNPFFDLLVKKIVFDTGKTFILLVSNLTLAMYIFSPICMNYYSNRRNFKKNLSRRKIVEVILLNFRSNLGHKDKLEVI